MTSGKVRDMTHPGHETGWLKRLDGTGKMGYMV
jgi:hypothetical protein